MRECRICIQGNSISILLHSQLLTHLHTQSLLAYGLATLSPLPNVTIYIDAAHAGWLGWPDVRLSTSILLKMLMPYF